MKNNNTAEDKLPLENFNSKTAGMSYSLSVILYLVISLLFSGIIALSNLESSSDIYKYLSYTPSFLAIIVTLVVIFCVQKINVKSVFPVKCHYKYYIIGVLLIFGLFFSLSWVNTFSVKFFKLFGYVPRGEGEDTNYYLPSLSGFNIVPAMLVIAVLPAILEESLFRGVLLRCGEESVGGLRIIFIVGMCFSLYHASPEQTVYQFICGCVFAFIAVRSGSIMPSVVMHFLNNGVIIVLYATNLINESGNLAVPDAVNYVIYALSALCLIVGLVLLIIDKKPFKPCKAGGVKNFFIYASVGIVALALIWIVSLFGVS